MLVICLVQLKQYQLLALLKSSNACTKICISRTCSSVMLNDFNLTFCYPDEYFEFFDHQCRFISHMLTILSEISHRQTFLWRWNAININYVWIIHELYMNYNSCMNYTWIIIQIHLLLILRTPCIWYCISWPNIYQNELNEQLKIYSERFSTSPFL